MLEVELLSQVLHIQIYQSRSQHSLLLFLPIDVSASIKEQSLARLRLPCRYDEYSEDIPANQVMKLTARYLCRSGQVSQSRRDALKRLLPFLSGVSDLSPGSVRWDQVKCRPDNRPCRSLIGICRLVMEHLLFANPDGSREIRGYMDGQPMHLLYEKFILEYYRRHFPGLSPNPELIRWNVTGGQALHLPLMRTDLVLRGAGKTLIIDAKYYSHSMQSYRDPDSPTIRSGNLYQIYAYAKNLDRDRTGSVAGLLLYARTKEPVVPDDSCEIDGTLIAAKTLDLSLPFLSLIHISAISAVSTCPVCAPASSAAPTARRKPLCGSSRPLA